MQANSTKSTKSSKNKGLLIGLGGFFAGGLTWSLLQFSAVGPGNKALIVGMVCLAVSSLLALKICGQNR